MSEERRNYKCTVCLEVNFLNKKTAFSFEIDFYWKPT